MEHTRGEVWKRYDIKDYPLSQLLLSQHSKDDGISVSYCRMQKHSERELCGQGSWQVRRHQHNPFIIKYNHCSWGIDGIHNANNLVLLEHIVSKQIQKQQHPTKKRKFAEEESMRNRR
jgi:hypothetical protein